MRLIPLSRGLNVAVDDVDFERFGSLKWYAQRGGKRGKFYAARTEKVDGRKKIVYLHRAITGCPPELDVDHENGDTLDCQRSNISPGTTAKNLWNIRSEPTGAVKYRGVSINRHGFPVASIRANGKAYQLGTFETEEAAHLAYEFAKRLRDAGRAAEITKSPNARVQRRRS